MKKVSRLFLTTLFVSVLWVQAFHHHSAHEGGMAAPHTDCVVCAWTQGSHVPYISAINMSVGAGIAAFSLVRVASHFLPQQFLSTTLSRAPPLA